MDMARNVAALLSPDSAVVPPSGFSAALAEVKRNGRPMTIDFAEILSRKLGGVEGIGERLVEDLKKLRGEHLPPDMQQFHEPDFKVVKGFYEIITKAMASRDTMVGEHGDPLDGVSEEDLMLIAAQAAFVRIPEDADFRRQLIDMIVEVDPELVLEAAAVALDKVPVRGTVEVLDAT
jgi:hypothetical protein